MKDAASWGWRALLESKWQELESTASPLVGELASADLKLPFEHGSILVAIDSDRHRHLLLEFDAESVIPVDRRSGGLQLSGRRLVLEERELQFADVHCVAPELHTVFLSFVTNLVEIVSGDPGMTALQLQLVLDAWRNLLAGRKSPWTDSRTAGLFGELLVLSKALDVNPAWLSMWRGPLGEAQDFRWPRNAIEVKSSLTQEGRSVQIHGLDQLEEPHDGILSLAWFRLAVASAGSTVDELAEMCRRKSQDPLLLTHLLELQGWDTAGSEVRALRFVVAEERLFTVDDAFPKLTVDSLGGSGVPGGLSHVSYRVDLDVLPDPGLDWSGLWSRILKAA